MTAPPVNILTQPCQQAWASLSEWNRNCLTQYTGRVAAIWIPNAVLLASLLKHPRRAWPELIGVAFLAYFSADMLVHDHVLTGAGLSVANIVEILVVALPMRWLGFDRDFSRTESLVA